MLLKTKLHLPKRAVKLVKRPQIVQLFSLDHRLTMLIAPAGYGKTNIVLEWLESLSPLVAWLSLDKGDNDANQFTQYLLAAFENISPEFTKLREQVIDIVPTLSIEYVLTALINIFVDFAKPAILVLDDYHLIHNPDIHAAITFLIENKPTNLHTIIMSRSELPFPIGRWRAKNEVTELRATDLQLSQAEMGAFFTAQNLTSLSNEDIQALATRTEGWIAALQLSAIAMQGKENVSDFISDFTGSHMYVVDYLADEVMQQQPEYIQHFLMQTSLLPRLSANLCDDILGIEDSQRILRSLEAQNLFLISLDNHREWYRYHHLFQDMLRYRLQREIPARLTALHHLASQWFIQHGWLEEGFSHAMLADDWQTVIQIVNQNITAMFSQGKITTVRRWFSQLPNDIILKNAELCINYAWALNLSGASDKMTSYLKQAKQLLQQNSETGHLEAQVSILQGYQSRRGNKISQSISHLQKALTILPPDEHVFRATTHIHLGIAHQLQANLKYSLYHFEQAQHFARQHYLYSFAAAAGLEIGVHVAMGKLLKSEQLCRSMMNEQDNNPGFGYIKMVLGAILLETNQQKEAETILKQTIELGYLSADYTFCIHSLITLAQLYQQQMRLADANACLQQAQKLMQQTQAHFGNIHYDQAQIQLWILEKNSSAILAWLAKQSMANSIVGYQLIYAKGLIATEQYRQAIWILEKVEIPAEHIEFRIQVQNLLAVAYKLVRDDERSYEAIIVALTLAEPAGFQCIFAVFNHMMLPILKDILTNYTEVHSFSVAYVGQLIRLLQDGMQVKQALNDPLTDREITVLRLMAAGLTNRLIAEELVISIGTVKGYSRNIYSKLAVTNRQDAVQSAFELNLI